MNLEGSCILCRHKKPWVYKQLLGLKPGPSSLEKKISVRKIKAELHKEYVMSLKKVVCKDRASINGMQ